jgi:hypothetical protein
LVKGLLSVIPRAVKETEPAFTVPELLVTVALRVTFWAFGLKVMCASDAVVVVGAATGAVTLMETVAAAPV